ncbi:MAG TPA: hypothetical protein VLU43_15785 [Anaeromyxobacteraceae bacterium]|nr:hypothetical protein [Anaeromyxobacteraceae bacterium]
MRQAARLFALLGAAAVGLVLFRSSPRDVKLVYDLARAPGAAGLDVEIRRGAETVRRAELRVAPGSPLVTHEVRLPDGDYALVVRVARPGAPFRVDRPLDVRESGTVVIPLGP